jgi:hypothetical protein
MIDNSFARNLLEQPGALLIASGLRGHPCLKTLLFVLRPYCLYSCHPSCSFTLPGLLFPPHDSIDGNSLGDDTIAAFAEAALSMRNLKLFK